MLKTTITQITILIIFLSVFCSCGKEYKTYPATLLQIDSLSENEAKKALPLLERLKDSLSTFDEEQQMYYDLLSLKVKDKMYIEHTSDSTIKRITSFYEQYGDRDKLLECYYYMGRVYRDLQDSPEALKYFQRALDIAGDTKQYLLLSKIYSQMGTLYYYQNVYEEAIPMYQKAYKYVVLSGDSTTLSMPVCYIAEIYNEMGVRDSSIVFYIKAYNLAIKTGKLKIALDIGVGLAGIYREMGQFDSAKRLLFHSMLDTVDRSLMPTCYSIGKLYLKMNKLDSARFYMKKTLFRDNIYTLAETYDCLSRIEEGGSNYRDAVLYARSCQQYEDSIQKITASEEIRKMRALYNYQLKNIENQRLMQENIKAKTMKYQLVFCGLLILFFVGLYLYRIKWRKKQAEEQARKLQKEKNLQYSESQALIQENNGKISDLQSLLLHEKEVRNTLQKDLIEVQKELLSVTNKRIELRHAERDLLEINLKHSDVYKKFHSANRTNTIKITDSDWSNLSIELDIAYNNLTDRLYELYSSFSQIELRICYLIKISVKVSDMALLLNRSKSSISSARSRLYTKLTGEEGTPEQLDALIGDF